MACRVSILKALSPSRLWQSEGASTWPSNDVSGSKGRLEQGEWWPPKRSALPFCEAELLLHGRLWKLRGGHGLTGLDVRLILRVSKGFSFERETQGTHLEGSPSLEKHFFGSELPRIREP